jgi:hypothetical protein
MYKEEYTILRIGKVKELVVKYRNTVGGVGKKKKKKKNVPGTLKHVDNAQVSVLINE